MSTIRYCKRCGNPLAEKSRFCDNCGAPVMSSAETGQSGRGHSPVDSNRNMRPIQPNYGNQAGMNPNNGQMRRPTGQNLSNGQVRRPTGQNPGNGQMPRSSGQNMRNTAQVSEEQRRVRYQQAQMDREWQQNWNQEPEEEERGFTAVQYVLIGLMVILLIALIIFTAFWIFGRSSNKTADERNPVQSSGTVQQQAADQDANVIEILSGSGQQIQTEAPITVQTEKITERQTEVLQDMVISYPEFSVTIPGSWKGKYGITQNGDSYTFYHQGSKVQGYGGEFFTITCYKDTSYKNKAGGQVLGMGNGTAYVLTVPSGTVYPQENQAVAEEYKRMNLDFGGISSRFRMLVSGEGPKETEPQQIIEIQESPNQQVEMQENQQEQQSPVSSGSGYISESSSRALTDADVAGMSYDDMQMAINEIYARHGRRFASESIQNYFESQSWYSGTVAPEEFSESVFSATEAQNIQFLLNKMGIQ